VSGFGSYEEALAAGSPDEPAGQVAGSGMVYTSGTTGRPKGVFPAGIRAGDPLEALQGAAQGLRHGLGIADDARILLVGPIYHSGQWTMTNYPLLCGIPLTMRRLPVPEDILAVIDEQGITNAVFNPIDFVRLLKLPDERRAAFDGSTLVRALHGGAPCSPAIKQQMIDWWGPVLYEFYGASEGGLFCLSTTEEWLAHRGSVGRVMPFLEVQVIADDGSLAAPGAEGLIYFRHRSGADFSYHKLPEKTAEAHREPGLFTLGDVGYLDSEGFLYLSDRRSEQINSGGLKFYPAEVEGVLAAHPAVADVAVFAVPNEELGEEAKAAVQLDPAVAPSDELAASLIAYAAERLAPGKAPRSIDFFDALPRTDAGKLAKAALKAKYWEGAGRRI
jgi:long-chain acyl-CoA synthetase